MPMLDNGKICEQFTIGIGVELVDADERFDIVHSVPRIRDELYNELLDIVTFLGAARPSRSSLS